MCILYSVKNAQAVNSGELPLEAQVKFLRTVYPVALVNGEALRLRGFQLRLERARIDSDWRFEQDSLYLPTLGVAWLNTERDATRSSIRGWRMVWYFPWLVGRILKSGFHLSRLILNPALPIDPKMIRHRTELQDDGSIVLWEATTGVLLSDAQNVGSIVVSPWKMWAPAAVRMLKVPS